MMKTEIIERKMPEEITEAIKQNRLILEMNMFLIQAWARPPMMVKE